MMNILATETTSTLDFSPITDALASAFSPAEIMAIIAAGLGIAVTFVLLWWGSRKLIGMVMVAFKSGRIKL